MDPMYDSCYSLNTLPITNPNTIDISASSKSLSKYQSQSFKNLLPQILATIISTSFHVVVGIALVYAAILVPQLEDDPEFEITSDDASWITSVMALTTPIGMVCAGFIMDHFGRLNTIKLATIPGASGWVLIAVSTNVPMLIVGRILTSFATALGSSPAIVYITEIARVDMRGSLISFIPALTSFGMVLNFVKGWFMTWRQVAWCCTFYTLIPCLLVFAIPESPPWLVSKNRIEEARQSLNWFNRYQPHPINKPETLAELELESLREDHLAKSRKKKGLALRELLKPTAYKPMLILSGLFIFQRFSGVFTFLFYSIVFLKEIGTTFNPYLASIIIGVVRMVVSMANTYVLSHYRRRPLMMISCGGTALFILSSAIFTGWIKQGSTTATWLPVLSLLLFVLTSMIGFVPIPVTMMAELYPLEIRGVAYSISSGLSNIIMFVSLKSYPFLLETFNGIVGLQYFFAAVSLLAVFYSYVFLPETHNTKLRDIEEYFKYNTTFVGRTVKPHEEQERGNEEQEDRFI